LLAHATEASVRREALSVKSGKEKALIFPLSAFGGTNLRLPQRKIRFRKTWDTRGLG
jgi:hypothetical protein